MRGASCRSRTARFALAPACVGAAARTRPYSSRAAAHVARALANGSEVLHRRHEPRRDRERGLARALRLALERARVGRRGRRARGRGEPPGRDAAVVVRLVVRRRARDRGRVRGARGLPVGRGAVRRDEREAEVVRRVAVAGRERERAPPRARSSRRPSARAARAPRARGTPRARPRTRARPRAGARARRRSTARRARRRRAPRAREQRATAAAAASAACARYA